jgi:hypothetical protein
MKPVTSGGCFLATSLDIRKQFDPFVVKFKYKICSIIDYDVRFKVKNSVNSFVILAIAAILFCKTVYVLTGIKGLSHIILGTKGIATSDEYIYTTRS